MVDLGWAVCVGTNAAWAFLLFVAAAQHRRDTAEVRGFADAVEKRIKTERN